MSCKTVAFLPYIETNYFMFGGLYFWQFYNDKTRKKIKELDLSFLDWYLSKFVDEKQEKLDVTLVSFSDEKIIDKYTDNQINKMYDVISVLCFLSLFKNFEFNPICLENFILHVKNFKPNEKSFAIEEGSFIKVNKFYSGEKITDKMKFMKPIFIPTFGFNKDPWLSDKDLFDGMSKAIVSNYEEGWFKRVVRSINICNTSNSNSINMGKFSRILTLVVAFEVLFDRNTSSKNNFSEAIVDCIGVPGNSEFNTELKKICKKLYKIRSRYSHGDSLNNLKEEYPQYDNYFKLGIYTYGLVIKSILRNKGFIDNDEYERVVKELNFGLFSLMEDNK